MKRGRMILAALIFDLLLMGTILAQVTPVIDWCPIAR